MPAQPFHRSTPSSVSATGCTRARDRTDSIALVRLMELLFEFLTGELRLDPKPGPKRSGAITGAAAATTNRFPESSFCPKKKPSR